MNEDRTVTEHGVFWMGGTPGQEKREENPADAQEFQQAIAKACEQAGCPMQRFVSAMGPYGTWVAEIHRANETQRILWNGRSEELVLQTPLPNGGWEDPVTLQLAGADLDVFTSSIPRLFEAVGD